MSDTAKRCLVIGANGFIGSHLVDELVAAGFVVRAFDRFSRPAQFKENGNVETYPGDFFDDITVSKALHDVQYVFHSFSATTPFTADADPYTDISSNVLRNIQLFEKCVEAGVEKVVFISSGGAIYGNIAEQNSVREDDAPKPVSPYGIGKLTSEHYLSYYNRKYGLDYVAYRLSNPYGPRQITKNNQGVIPSFIQKMSDQEEISVIGDGTSSRDYIYIGDATAMMVSSFQYATDKTYNLGSGKQTTVKEIINCLQKLLVVEPTIRYLEEPKTFLKHANISVERFQKEFGNRSLTPLEEGLTITWNNLRVSE